MRNTVLVWRRRDDWRQARAMERGDSVPPRASREMSREEIASLPEDLRRLFVCRGEVYRGNASGVLVIPYTGEERVWDGSYVPREVYGSCELTHDSDELKGEDLVAVLRKALEVARAKAREQAAKEEERQRHQDDLAKQYRELLRQYWNRSPEEIAANDIFPDPPPGLDPSMAEVVIDEMGDTPAAKRYWAWQEGQKRAAEEAAKAEMIDWIEAHGSPRLKALVREGIECEYVYRDERLALERPGWTWKSLYSGCAQPVKGEDVTDKHLAALEAARKTAPDAKLVWIIGDERVRSWDCLPSGGMCGLKIPPYIAIAAKFMDREIRMEIV